VSTGLDGADVVIENLRQICIFQQVNNTGHPELWWDYVTAFDNLCSGSKATWNQTCSDNIQKSLGMNTQNVAKCVTDSGGTTSGTNVLLEQELIGREEDGAWYLPTVIINDAAYRGSLSCPTPIIFTTCGVLGAICSGFPPDKLPCSCVAQDTGCNLCEYKDCAGRCGGTSSFDKCDKCLLANDTTRVDAGGVDPCGVCMSTNSPQWGQSCLGCDNVPNSGVKRDACGECGGSKTGSDQCSPLSTSAIVGIVIACVAVTALAIFFIVRRQQTRMRDDIDSLLAQYQPLEGHASPANPGGAHPSGLPTDIPIHDSDTLVEQGHKRSDAE